MAKVYFYDAENNRIEAEVSDEMRGEVAAFMRNERRRREYEEYHTVSLDAILEKGHEFPSVEESPETILIEREDAAERSEYLQRLPEVMKELTLDQQVMIRKVYFKGMTQREIAKEEGVDETSISKRMSRIYARLKKLLKK